MKIRKLGNQGLNVSALGLGCMGMSTLAAKEIVKRFGFRAIGQTDDCKQQFYAITPEGKLTHPAVVAITSHAKAALRSSG